MSVEVGLIRSKEKGAKKNYAELGIILFWFFFLSLWKL